MSKIDYYFSNQRKIKGEGNEKCHEFLLNHFSFSLILLLFCLVVFFTYFDEHCVSLKNWQQSKEKYLLPFEGWQHIQYSINNPRDKTLHPEHPSQLTPVWNALGINCIPSKYYVLAWKRNFFWTNTNHPRKAVLAQIVSCQ